MSGVKLNIRQSGDWDMTEKLLRRLKQSDKLMKGIVAAEARHAARLVLQNLNSRGKLTGTTWPKLKRATLKLKKRKSILMETKQMANAITAIQVGDGKWFIGVSSGEMHKGRGGSITLAKLAATHENGAVITQVWTPKQMRAFFAIMAKIGMRRLSRRTAKKAVRPQRARGPDGRYAKLPRSPARKGITVVIRIPPRPFIYPVLEKLYDGAQSEVERRIMRRLESALKIPKPRASKPK